MTRWNCSNLWVLFNTSQCMLSASALCKMNKAKQTPCMISLANAQPKKLECSGQKFWNALLMSVLSNAKTQTLYAKRKLKSKEEQKKEPKKIKKLKSPICRQTTVKWIKKLSATRLSVRTSSKRKVINSPTCPPARPSLTRWNLMKLNKI